MKVITVVSDTNNEGCQQLRRSLKHHGYELDVMEHPFKFGDQMRHIYEWCKRNWGTFLYTDGWDTFALGGPVELELKYGLFKAQGAKLVISAEKNCYPLKETASQYPHTCETEWKYCNGGGFMGECEMFVEMYEDGLIETVHDRNDQQWLAEQYCKRFSSGKVSLDTGCEIFQTMAFEGDDDFGRVVQPITKYTAGWKDQLRLLNNKTDSYPIFVHGNAHVPLKKIWNLL